MKHSILLFCLFVATVSFDANAQEDAAKTAFEEGSEYFANEQYVEAAEAFRQAYELKPTWKLLFNMAQAETAAKQYGLALEAFETYLVDGGDEIPVVRVDSVRNEISRLRDMVGTVEVKTHEGAEIYIDNILRGTAPLYGGMSVTAGKTHEVKVVFQDETLPLAPVKVKGGATVELEILQNSDGSSSHVEHPQEDVAGNSQPLNPEDDTAPTKAKRLKTMGAVTLGVGVVSLGAGGITGGMVLSQESEFDKNCQGTYCEESYETDSTSQKKLATVSTVMFAVGGAATVAGVVMLIIGKKITSEKLSVAPLLSPTVAGASMNVRF